MTWSSPGWIASSRKRPVGEGLEVWLEVVEEGGPEIREWIGCGAEKWMGGWCRDR